jgi:hypothetical protein
MDDRAFLTEIRRGLLILLRAVEQRLSDQEPRQTTPTRDDRKPVTSGR